MVWAGRVVAVIWAAADESFDNLLEPPAASNGEESPSVRRSSYLWSRTSNAAAEGEGNAAKNRWSWAMQKVASAKRVAKQQIADKRTEEALRRVERVSKFEIAQWLMLLLYIIEILVVGNIAEPDHPLWDGGMTGFVVSFVLLGLVLVSIGAFTLKNLRLTLVKREGKQTVEYVAAFLGRITLVLLVQHLCFFFVGIAATNMNAAIQPIAFSDSSDLRSGLPCALVTAEYIAANCARSFSVYDRSAAGTLDCHDAQDWGGGYLSAYDGCVGVQVSVQLRNMGYAAVMLSINVFLYVLLKECMRDAGKMALSKMTRGKADTRTSLIFAISGVALCCCPLFLAYMLLSPSNIFYPSLVNLLTLVFGLNVVCWVAVGLLLNAEFLLANLRHKVEYDVFISYRVRSDRDLAADLYKKLKGEGLRVFLDQVCLKDGEPWERGFLRGLGSSQIYVLLFTREGMTNLANLAESSAVDNVLLEIRMARELKQHKKEQFVVFPLLLGSNDGTRFEPFDFWPNVAQFPDIAVSAVEDRLKLKSRDVGIGGGVTTSGSIKENIDWLFEIQGVVTKKDVEMDYASVLKESSKRIAMLSDDVKKRSDAGGSMSELCQQLCGCCSGTIRVGETVILHNPNFMDVTRLRVEPKVGSTFNEHSLEQGSQVEVLALKGLFAKVRATRDGAMAAAEGWVRVSNLMPASKRPKIAPSGEPPAATPRTTEDTKPPEGEDTVIDVETQAPAAEDIKPPEGDLPRWDNPPEGDVKEEELGG